MRNPTAASPISAKKKRRRQREKNWRRHMFSRRAPMHPAKLTTNTTPPTSTIRKA